MAKEVVTRCDKCGEAREDVATYTLRWDGLVYEVDLDEEHAAPLKELAALGRQIDADRGRESTRSLERRIRGVIPE